MADLTWLQLLVSGFAAIRAMSPRTPVTERLADASNPARRGSAERRRREGLRLTADYRDTLATLTAGLRAGTLSLADWQRLAVEQARVFMARGAILGAGSMEAAASPYVTAQLDRLAAQVAVRAEALAGRIVAGERTVRQAGAALAQGAGGRVHAATQAGGSVWLQSGPVRWIMRDGADHCGTCPGFARTYRDLEALLETTGGLPGEADTECFGNCQCSVEAASEYSTYADTNELLVRRGGLAGLPAGAG